MSRFRKPYDWTAGEDRERNNSNARLARARRGRKIVHELLAAYWCAGDGEDPPEFIKRAMRYCGYTAAPISVKGKKQTFLPGKVRI